MRLRARHGRIHDMSIHDIHEINASDGDIHENESERYGE